MERARSHRPAGDHCGRLPAAGLGPGPVGVYAPDGALLALVEEHGEVAKPLAVFVP